MASASFGFHEVHFEGDFFEGGLAVQLLLQVALDAVNWRLMVSTMCTGMRMVRAWSAMALAAHGLADPPRGVGAEFEAEGVVELVDGV